MCERFERLWLELAIIHTERNEAMLGVLVLDQGRDARGGSGPAWLLAGDGGRECTEGDDEVFYSTFIQWVLRDVKELEGRCLERKG